MSDKLTPFEDSDVIRCAIEIPGAAGGLRDALRFDPIELHHGEERVLVMKVRREKVRFDPVKDTDALSRVHVLKPLEDLTAFIDEDLVREQLDAQAERVRLLREQENGVSRLAFESEQQWGEQFEMETAEALAAQHRSGAHADGPRDDCPMCEDGFE